MDLARLIQTRMRKPGESYRVAEQRAKAAGHPISRSKLNAYANGTRRRHPDEETITALTAALDLPQPEVAAAVHESFGVDAETGRDRHQNTWLRLTEGRTDEEIEQLLAAVKIILGIRDDIAPAIPQPRRDSTPDKHAS